MTADPAYSGSVPIRPETRHLYPADWPEISRRIRFDRAGGRCECRDHCRRGVLHLGTDDRCDAVHGTPHKRWRIILTTAHLNHDPADCRDENLLAMCQACHLAYDADHHAETRRLRKHDPTHPLLF